MSKQSLIIEKGLRDGFNEKIASLPEEMLGGGLLGLAGGGLGGAGVEVLKQVIDEKQKELNFKNILRTGVGSGLGGAAGGVLGGGLNNLMGNDSRLSQELALRIPIILGSIAGAKLSQDKKIQKHPILQKGKEILG
jgi:MFS family permease